jgi:assimilatory nitrate reductase catalytic subunit
MEHALAGVQVHTGKRCGSDRLTSPLVREDKHATLREASWDEALARITERIVSVQDRFGADAVGVFGGGGLTNEKAYSLGKFARVALETRHIDYNGRFCMASAAVANVKAFGLDRGLPFPLEDIPNAETIFIAGGNPADTMPPIMQYFEEQRRRGGKPIVSDPRRTNTAKTADLHLQLAPGTDAALANGLLHVAIKSGLIDRDFIEARTSGFEAAQHLAEAYWPDRVERITGVPARSITQAAHMLGEAATATAMTFSARGTEQQVQGVNNVLALINLMLALGKVGRSNSGYGCLTGQGNGQGGREHGQKADQLPGYRCINDPDHRAWIAKIWNVEERLIPTSGRSATELFDLLGKDVRALIVLGANPAVSAPNAGNVIERLKALDFLVVFDFFPSETAMHADVILPVTQWAEEDGTMTNLEGWIIRRRRALDAPFGVRSDIEILADLARRLGHSDGFYAEPKAIFDELCRASANGPADYSGVSYKKIEEMEGVFWPCPSKDHPGTARLFLDRFHTEDGRARFHPIEHRPSAEEPDDSYPLFVSTGRLLAHYQTGVQTRRVPELAAVEPEPIAEIHPAIAATFDLDDGDMVRVSTRRGSAVFKIRLTSDIRMDTVFLPFHWADSGAANLVTNDSLDPISKIPEFKICAGRIAAIDTNEGTMTSS